MYQTAVEFTNKLPTGTTGMYLTVVWDPLAETNRGQILPYKWTSSAGFRFSWCCWFQDGIVQEAVRQGILNGTFPSAYLY